MSVLKDFGELGTIPQVLLIMLGGTIIKALVTPRVRVVHRCECADALRELERSVGGLEEAMRRNVQGKRVQTPPRNKPAIQ